MFERIKSSISVDDSLKYFKDIKINWGFLILCGFISMILGLIFLYLMKFAGFLVWFGIFLYFVVLGLAGAYLKFYEKAK